MAERIVTNTSPLLAFARMQAFEFIGKLPFEFLCPNEVKAEIPDWLKIVNLQSSLSPVAVAALDVGEAAVIRLAPNGTSQQFALTNE